MCLSQILWAHSLATGSTKFMATYILTWFSNKNEENGNMKTIHLSFIQYDLLYLFLIICFFSLPWRALHEAYRTSCEIKAHSRCNLAFRFSRGWITPKSLKDSGPGSLRANLSCWWTPGRGPESTVGSFLSHVRAPSLAGRSKVLPRSALEPMATVHLPKCPRCTAGCSISLLSARK